MLLVYKSFCLPRSRDLRAIDLMFYFEQVAIFESIEVNWGCYWLILLRDSVDIDASPYVSIVSCASKGLIWVSYFKHLPSE